MITHSNAKLTNEKFLVLIIEVFPNLTLFKTSDIRNMLPDLPIFKIELEKIILKRMQNIEKSSIISEFKKSKIFEGRKSVLIREDGSRDEIKMKRHQVDVSLKFDDIENAPAEEILKKIDEAGSKLTNQKTKTMFDKISQVTKSVGNEFSLKGKQFKIDHFFEALRKIFIDFDENEKPYLPTFFNAPESAIEDIKKIETDNEVKREFEEIMKVKKEEWRAIENRRKLVG